MFEYNICYSLDNKYTEQTAVSIASILKNADIDDNVNFYILDGGLTKEDKNKLELLRNVKNFNIEYIKVNNNDFKNCPLLQENNKEYHVTIPTYYRFKLATYLNKLDKVLYLDCDIIVRTSLKELYNIDISKYAAAMVPDAESKKEALRLNIKKYFNAGLMLINLDFWRKNNIENLLFDYALNNKDKILWQDQDIFNVVLSGKIKELDNTWNFQYFQYEKVDNTKLSQINIIHLAGRFKPWLIPFEHSVYDLYYYYLSFSAWKNKIAQYKQISSGKYLKNGIGGSVTNILVNSTDEDIQKAYKVINDYYQYTKDNIKNINADTDRKINAIYDEIGKNYDFTKEEITKQNNITTQNTDEKISKIYEEITKNYNYTNELAQNLKTEVYSLNLETDNKLNNIITENNQESDRKINAIYDEIGKNYDFTKEEITKQNNITIQNTDEKISKIYEEITKNYNYTNELAQNLKTEVYSLNLETDNKLNNIITENNQESDRKINAIYDEIGKNYDFTKEEITKQNNITIQNTDEKISKIYEEITKNYNYTNELAQNLKAEQEQKIDEVYNNLNQSIKETSDNIESNFSQKLKETADTLENNFLKEIKTTNDITEWKLKESTDNLRKETVLKFSEAYAYINNQNSDLFNEIKSTGNILEANINYKLNDLYKADENANYEINKIKTKLEDKIEQNVINTLQTEFNEKIQLIEFNHNEEINKLKTEYDEKINYQRIKYEKKLINMENQIKLIENTIKESKQNIFIKLMKKLKR